MKYKELVERVEWGEEFLFVYNDESYWISQNENGRYLTKVKGCETQEFRTTKELFEKGRIEGKKICDIWEEIKEYF